jgi:hypothetical protein
MPSIGWSGVKLAGVGNTFSGVMNHTSPSDSPTDKSGFGGGLPECIVPTVKVGGGGIMV